jgi:hypothetical protein
MFEHIVTWIIVQLYLDFPFFFKFTPLDIITLIGFLVIPLNSNYFPSKDKFMKSSSKLKVIDPNDYYH